MKKRTVRLRSKRDPAAGSGKQRTRQSQADLKWFTNALDVLIAKAAKRQRYPVCVLINLGRAKNFIHGDLLAQGATDDDICHWLAEHGLVLPPELDTLADRFSEDVADFWQRARRHVH